MHGLINIEQQGRWFCYGLVALWNGIEEEAWLLGKTITRREERRLLIYRQVIVENHARRPPALLHHVAWV